MLTFAPNPKIRIMSKESKELLFKIAKAILMVLASYFGGASVSSCSHIINLY